MFGEKIEPPENFSAPKDGKIIAETNDGFSVSIKNLQNDFAENFSALAPFIDGIYKARKNSSSTKH